MRLGNILVALLTVSGAFALADSELPEQEYAALDKKAPVYPHVSQFNGIEGYCIVEYPVTAQGATSRRVSRGVQPRRVVRGDQCRGG